MMLNKQALWLERLNWVLLLTASLTSVYLFQRANSTAAFDYDLANLITTITSWFVSKPEVIEPAWQATGFSLNNPRAMIVIYGAVLLGLLFVLLSSVYQRFIALRRSPFSGQLVLAVALAFSSAWALASVGLFHWW